MKIVKKVKEIFIFIDEYIYHFIMVILFFYMIFNTKINIHRYLYDLISSVLFGIFVLFVMVMAYYTKKAFISWLEERSAKRRINENKLVNQLELKNKYTVELKEKKIKKEHKLVENEHELTREERFIYVLKYAISLKRKVLLTYGKDEVVKKCIIFFPSNIEKSKTDYFVNGFYLCQIKPCRINIREIVEFIII